MRYGDQAGDVPSSDWQLSPVLNLYSIKCFITIETHLEQLREERESMKVLESAAEIVYPFTVDVPRVEKLAATATEYSAAGERRAEVELGLYRGVAGVSGASLTDEDTELSVALAGAAKDVLPWKLQCTEFNLRLKKDDAKIGRRLIAMARYEAKICALQERARRAGNDAWKRCG